MNGSHYNSRLRTQTPGGRSTSFELLQLTPKEAEQQQAKTREDQAWEKFQKDNPTVVEALRKSNPNQGSVPIPGLELVGLRAA